MRKMGWLTVDSLPSTTKTLAFTVPDSQEWLAQLRGALLPLIYEENYEDFGSVTARDNADWWRCFILEFFEEKEMFPSGMIVQYGGFVAPEGWLLCNGQQLLIANYASLFAAIEWAFDTNLADTDYFAVPNFESRFPVGWDNGNAQFSGMGGYGGEEQHQLTVGEMPVHNHAQNSHNHTQNSHNHTQDSHAHDFYSRSAAGVSGSPFHPVITTRATIPNQQSPQSVAGTVATNQAATATNQAATATNQSEGGGQDHNNLPPFLVVNFIIKI